MSEQDSCYAFIRQTAKPEPREPFMSQFIPSPLLVEAFAAEYNQQTSSVPEHFHQDEVTKRAQVDQVRELLNSPAGQGILQETALKAQIGFLKGFADRLQKDSPDSKIILLSQIVNVFNDAAENMEGQLAGLHVDFLK